MRWATCSPEYSNGRGAVALAPRTGHDVSWILLRLSTPAPGCQGLRRWQLISFNGPVPVLPPPPVLARRGRRVCGPGEGATGLVATGPGLTRPRGDTSADAARRAVP